MHTDDAHVQHTWLLANDSGEITIDLWIDDYTVRIDGGPDDGDQRERGRADVDDLLAKYQAAGYRLVRDYPVNDPEPDCRPDKCPQCGDPVTYEPCYGNDYGEGPAWLCTGCKWGEWITA